MATEMWDAQPPSVAFWESLIFQPLGLVDETPLGYPYSVRLWRGFASLFFFLGGNILQVMHKPFLS